MNLSRRDLERLGEPISPQLPTAIDRRCGGGGDSSSSSQANTSVQNIDRRQVNDGGAIGITSDGGTISIQTTDQGAVTDAIKLAQANAEQTTKQFQALADAQDSLAKSNARTQQANLDLAQGIVNAGTKSAQNVSDQLSNFMTAGLDLFKQNIGLATAVVKQDQQATASTLSIASDLAAKPLNATNDNRYIIGVGLAVIGVVAFSAMKKG